jgi:putative PIN family toxin of toxin-antitoxin system
MQRYVLDTNVLVASISTRSPHHWIWQSLTQKKEFYLCVTTEILEEYEEILQRFYKQDTVTTIMETLENLSNIVFITRYYRWNFIIADPDDDKFVDCAIAAQAKYIVSEDNHLQILNREPLFFLKAIKIVDFKEIMGK